MRPPPPTRRFGRYDAFHRIASGENADVFAARVCGEAGFEKLVAVKRLHPHLSEDPAFVRRFFDEARIVAHVSSPHVVSTIDIGRDEDGCPYVVLELVRGVTLGAILERLRERGEQLPVPIAVELIAQAAIGLQDAYDATTPAGTPLYIVHRNLAPWQLLVSVDGHVKLKDFGVAHAMHHWTTTHRGSVKRDAEYYSPEAVAGHSLGHASDVFSLGIVAWEALGGRRLFDGVSVVDAIHSVRACDVPPLHKVRPEVGSALSVVVSLALKASPSQRVQSAADFASALRAAVHSEQVEPATARSIATYVRNYGGDQLASLLGAIDVATQAMRDPGLAPPPPSDPAPAAPSPPSFVAARSTARRAQSGAPAQRPDASAAAGGMDKRLRMLVAAIVVLMGIGGGAWLASGRRAQPQSAAPTSTTPGLVGSAPTTTAITEATVRPGSVTSRRHDMPRSDAPEPAALPRPRAPSTSSGSTGAADRRPDSTVTRRASTGGGAVRSGVSSSSPRLHAAADRSHGDIRPSRGWVPPAEEPPPEPERDDPDDDIRVAR